MSNKSKRKKEFNEWFDKKFNHISGETIIKQKKYWDPNLFQPSVLDNDLNYQSRIFLIQDFLALEKEHKSK